MSLFFVTEIVVALIYYSEKLACNERIEELALHRRAFVQVSLSMAWILRIRGVQGIHLGVTAFVCDDEQNKISVFDVKMA